MTRASTSPRISVVMPAWNGERYLAEAIESVLAQTYADFELVIVDDGSEDASREVVARYAERDARIRPIHAPHRGLIATLNDGCRAACGEFIARTDADDLMLPERLEQQLAFLTARPAVALVAAGVEVMDPAGHLVRQPAVLPPFEHATICEVLAYGNCFIHSTVMMRRDAWLEVGGYHALYVHAEDYELWTRFADRYELAGMRTTVARYRIHPLQVSVMRLEEQALVALAISLSTRIRWKTGVDPLAGCQAITRDTSRSLGATDEEIDAHLLHAYMHCIQGLPALGLSSVGLEVVREITASRVFSRELEKRFPGSTGSTGTIVSALDGHPHPETAVLTS